MQYVWLTRSQSDMTEGRGGMTIDTDTCYRSEQDAWDQINFKEGVSGRKPSSGTWQYSTYRDHDVIKVGLFGEWDTPITPEDDVSDIDSIDAALAALDV